LEGVFPTAFLKKIKNIKVLGEEPGNGINEKSDIKTLGRFNSNFDEYGYLISGDILLNIPICVDKDSSGNAEFLVENDFRDTLAHEIGHGIHMSLNVDDLKKWEEVIGKDKTEITWYVGHSGLVSDNNKATEDFSESLMMFVKDPYLLRTLSENRFQYMKELFTNYMDSENLERFKNGLDWALKLSEMSYKGNGYTENDIKDYYLSKS
jgi:hypothetical protein